MWVAPDLRHLRLSSHCKGEASSTYACIPATVDWWLKANLWGAHRGKSNVRPWVLELGSFARQLGEDILLQLLGLPFGETGLGRPWWRLKATSGLLRQLHILWYIFCVHVYIIIYIYIYIMCVCVLYIYNYILCMFCVCIYIYIYIMYVCIYIYTYIVIVYIYIYIHILHIIYNQYYVYTYIYIYICCVYIYILCISSIYIYIIKYI